jgi:hypothetical protein
MIQIDLGFTQFWKNAEVIGQHSKNYSALKGGAHTPTNICWMCGADADPDSKPWWDFTSNAKWRSSRLSTFQFLKLLEKNKVSLCKLFEAPCFDISMVMVDVLHCLDLGVSQDALGNLFWLVVSTKVIFDGTTIKARVALLLRKIMGFYKVHKPVSELSNLTPEVIVGSQDATIHGESGRDKIFSAIR